MMLEAFSSNMINTSIPMSHTVAYHDLQTLMERVNSALNTLRAQIVDLQSEVVLLTIKVDNLENPVVAPVVERPEGLNADRGVQA